ncbi:MAG: hypothetical protein CSB34_06100 [Desulfobulbus propionicus]|nr:MAG: hypothetical protein CSB34_06100 [Desulfobulbus propionicus]
MNREKESSKKYPIREILERIAIIVEEEERGNVSSFSRKIGLSNQTVDNYLKGREPKISFITSICEAYKIKPDWLLLGNGSKKADKEEILEEINRWIKETGGENTNWFENMFIVAFPQFVKWQEKEKKERNNIEVTNEKIA